MPVGPIRYCILCERSFLKKIPDLSSRCTLTPTLRRDNVIWNKSIAVYNYLRNRHRYLYTCIYFPLESENNPYPMYPIIIIKNCHLEICNPLFTIYIDIELTLVNFFELLSCTGTIKCKNYIHNL